jgi:hypothetical protein
VGKEKIEEGTKVRRKTGIKDEKLEVKLKSN